MTNKIQQTDTSNQDESTQDVQTRSVKPDWPEPTLASWSIEQALWWVKSRRIADAETPQRHLPDFGAIVMFPSSSELPWLDVANDLLAALKKGSLIAIEGGLLLHPSYWNGIGPSQLGRVPKGVMVSAQDLMALFPKPPEPSRSRVPHEEVVRWCVAAIERGLTGQKTAEKEFWQEVRFQNLKRTAFREAYNEAKVLWNEARKVRDSVSG